MGMVQVAVHQVIDVTPMRHRLVATIRAVNVRLLMPGAVVTWCTVLWIGRRHLDAVIVNMTVMGMVQVSVVKIVRVAIMLHSRVAAIRAMLVAMST
jgi:hypothetical protein